MYLPGWCSSSAVRPRYSNAGPAETVMINPRSSSVPTGTTSVSCRRGGTTVPTAQKVRTPKRSSAMMAANPEKTSSPIRTQVTPVTGVPEPSAPNRAWMSANLATNPASGGRPVMISAQPVNASPRNASAAGIPTPTGSSGDSSIANASTVSASTAAPGERMRSTSSISSMNAATAKVEATR